MFEQKIPTFQPFFYIDWTVNSFSHILQLERTIYLFIQSDNLCEVQYGCAFGPQN